jgi:ABC-type transport system substrate-binding protein
VVAASLLAASLLAAACGSGSGGAEGATNREQGPSAAEREAELTPTSGGKVVFGIDAESDGWDEDMARWSTAGHLVASSMFETLAVVGEEGIEPFLAESIEPNEDLTRWVIAIRPGINFHDGTPLDAEAVKANLDRTVTSPLLSAAWAGVEDIEIVDDLTVAVNATAPWGSFPGMLVTQEAPIQFENPAEFENPIGTGPFVFEEWVPDSHLRVTKNEDYWQEGLPHLNEIEFRVLPSEATRIAALSTGELDLMLAGEPYSVTVAGEEFQAVSDAKGEETFIMLNAVSPPFDNLLARQALAYATDQEVLSQLMADGRLKPTDQLFNEGTPWHVEDSGFPSPDPDKARELVEQYEAETGEPLAFDFSGMSPVEIVEMQQALQQMWEEVGMDVEIKTSEQTAFIVDALMGDYQATIWRGFGFYDPDGEYGTLHSANAAPVGEMALNFSRYGSPEIDEALEAGRGTDDLATRQEAYATVTRELNENLPYIWLFSTELALGARPEVHGLAEAEATGFGRFDSKPWIAQLWVEE